jgi:hypothetical protein
MSKKTINVNPDLFSMSKKGRGGKTRKSRPMSLVSPNVMKRNLLQKIKEHKERNIISNQINENEEIGKFSSDFQDSMKYLKDLTENPGKYRNQRDKISEPFKPIQQITHQPHNKSLKNPYNYSNNEYNAQPTYNIAPVELEFPQEPMIAHPSISNQPLLTHPVQTQIQPDTENSKLSIPDVPYGCLKNGLKPTYRSWMKKTQKLSNIAKNNIVPPSETTIDYLKSKIKTDQSITDYHSGKLKKMPKRKYLIKRTKRKKYNLGKSKLRKTISVLIKGIGLRKKVIQEKIGLQNTNIQDVKNYLKKHGLLKAGSSCPEDVLRKMYESAVLSGYVKNKNKDVLIHNFLND